MAWPWAALVEDRSTTLMFYFARRETWPGDYEPSLIAIWLAWLLVIGLFYFPCRWFAAVKRRRRDWWLSYL